MSQADATAVDLQLARFEPGGSTLVKNAIVISGTSAGTFRGDLLLRGGVIAEVAPRVEAAGAEVVDAAGYIVCAGFIDTHRHMWQSLYKGFVYDITLQEVFSDVYGVHSPRFRPQDMYAGTLLSRLTALDAGITTVLDWAHNSTTPEMEDAGIDALRAAGGRAVFGHGFAGDRVVDVERYRDQPRTFKAAERVRSLLPDDDALLSSCYLGLEPPYLISVEACAEEFRIARELGMRISVHINSLSADGVPFPSLEAMHAAKLMGDDVTYVHLTGSTDQGLRLVGETGGTASISPQVEAHCPGFTPPPAVRLIEAGVRPSLSLDSTAAGSEDLVSQMRALFDVERALAKKAAESQSAGYTLTLEDVFDFATLQGARALGQERRLGSVTAGKEADLLFIDTQTPNMLPVLNPVASVVFHSSIGDIDTVLVHGTPVKRGGRLLANLAEVRRQVEESLDYLYWNAGRELPEKAVRPHPAAAPRSAR
jgi:cytosine/adenosine deaminase-related metal-dependent hydrolase